MRSRINKSNFIRNRIDVFALKNIAILVLFSLFLFTLPARSEDETLEEQFIKGNIIISRWLDQTAEDIDGFLISKKLTTEKNKTNLRLESTTYLIDGSKPSVSNTMQINLRLPKVEKYFQLKFANYDESEERRSNQQGNLRGTARPENYGATLGFFKKLGTVKTIFQPRIALQDPLQVSHSLKFESAATAGPVEIKPQLEFFANADNGTGIFVATNLGSQVSDRNYLRFTNEGEYEDLTHLLKVTNGVSLDDHLSRSITLTFSLFMNSLNQPHYNLDSYTFAITRFHMIYKNILDYSITPHLDFFRKERFKGNPGITFNIALNF